MNQIHLRAHHLICLQNFEGKGYSPKFATHMQHILDTLRMYPDDICIQKIEGGDDLCQYCPFYVNGKCTESDIVEALDRAYTALFPQKLSYNQLREITCKHLSFSKFESICKHCEWFNICHKHMNKSLQ